MTTIGLKEILDTVRQQSDLIPVRGLDGNVVKTFCNIALDRTLTLVGLPRMVNKLNGWPLCANDMIETMRNSPSMWTEVSGDTACARASQGIVVVAAQSNDSGHGHVAVVYPAPEQYSGSWAKNVPMLSNVGKENKVLKASQCFRTEPKYYSASLKA